MSAHQLPLFTNDTVEPKTYNIASLPQHSVFRYPGGKTWFVPYVRRWFAAKNARPEWLIEPFAGGGSIGLTCAFERLTDRVMLVEIDPNVAAVWHTILSQDAVWLAETILSFEINAHRVQDVLDRCVSSTRERAFQTILRNRVNRGGILAAGAGRMKNGEDGKGLSSRWYPATLARRILAIRSQQERLIFVESDGLSILHEYQGNPRATFFIDPPYTAGGKRAGQRLYDYSTVNHQHLFAVAHNLAGDFLMTYDDNQEIGELAQQYRLSSCLIPMKNAHHAPLKERLIGRDLYWLSDPAFHESS